MTEREDGIVIIDHTADAEVLKNWLFDLPLKSYDASVASFGSQENLRFIEKQAQDIKSVVTGQVCTEIGEDKKLKYTNVSARESEINNRLSEDGEYQKKTSQIREFSMEKDKNKSLAEYYGRLYTSVKLLVSDKLERERLNMGKELMLEKSRQMSDRN